MLGETQSLCTTRNLLSRPWFAHRGGLAAMLRHGAWPPTCDGYSVGEITAAYVAEVISLQARP